MAKKYPFPYRTSPAMDLQSSSPSRPMSPVGKCCKTTSLYHILPSGRVIKSPHRCYHTDDQAPHISSAFAQCICDMMYLIQIGIWDNESLFLIHLRLGRPLTKDAHIPLSETNNSCILPPLCPRPPISCTVFYTSLCFYLLYWSLFALCMHKCFYYGVTSLGHFLRQKWLDINF